MFKNKLILCPFLLLFLAATLSPWTNREESSSEKDVRGLIDSWAVMWNSYDLSMVDKLFLQDPRASYFSSEREGLIKGFDAVREHHEGFGFVEGGKSQENRLWMENVYIEVFGTAAVVTGIWYFQRGPQATGNPQIGPVTLVCVRQETEWRIAHANFSEYGQQKFKQHISFAIHKLPFKNEDKRASPDL